jgi:hypothetical protein
VPAGAAREEAEKGSAMLGVIRFIMAALSLIAAVPAVHAADSPGPRIQVTESRFDFGTVNEGDVPEHVFEIRNIGNEILVIEKVRPS